MSIPDALIEEVRARADLVEIVSEHTRLKRSGRTFRGPCPLHGGDGPNFSVDPARNLFKCFTCGESGDVFSFPMKHLGMNYVEAIRWVAARVGVEIPEYERRAPEEEPYAELYEVNAFASEWFRDRLLDPEVGREAREYLDGRGLTPEVRERFGIGWAPESWSAFADAARTHGIKPETLVQLGLLKEPNREGRDRYDAFRGRVIFPILSISGRVVGFGGRVIGPTEEHIPKYLNSPESPIYHKGEILYGLNWSRGAIRRDKERVALVVEGYVDYVSLAAHGIENAVAPLGTAMTQAQAELLARYAARVILLYDSDQAGLKATFRTGDELLRTGVEVLVATMPPGEDPDTLVRRGGAAALRGYLHDAVDLLERKIQILELRDYFSSIAGKRRAVDALLPTVRAAADEVLRGLYVARIAERTGVPVEVIEREAATGDGARGPVQAAAGAARGGGAGARGPSGGARAEVAAPPPRLGPERNLILLLLRDVQWIEKVAERLGPEDFRDPVYREIYTELLHLHAEGAARDGVGWLQALSAPVADRAQELLGDPEGENMTHADRFLAENLRDIESRNRQIARLGEIEREIAGAGGDHERQAALLAEKLELRQSMERGGMVLKVNPARRGGAGSASGSGDG